MTLIDAVQIADAILLIFCMVLFLVCLLEFDYMEEPREDPEPNLPPVYRIITGTGEAREYSLRSGGRHDPPSP